MKKHFGMLMLIALISLSARSQAIKVPAAVKTAFQAKFPGATDVKWGKENAKEYEAEFKLDGNKVSANFAQNGSWVETETSIRVSDLPAAVTSAINTKYPGSVITLAERVDAPGNKLVYEVSIKVNGKKKALELKPDGSPAK